MSTIVEVARRARVSPSTVSHVINRTRFVADDTRARVETAIEALGYRPNALARSLRVGHSHTLGLVLPDSANPFFAELGREIELAAFDAGFTVVLCNTGNDVERERLHLSVLAKQQVDGIIVIATDEPGDALRSVARHHLPVLVMDRERPDLPLDSVIADHLRGGQLATEHLLGFGHRRVGCIAGPRHVSTSNLRVAGYGKALHAAAIPLDPRLVVHGDFHAASGCSAARTLLALPRPPSAVFACNDLMAIGVLHAAAELGRRVPQDLAVVGYDDLELAPYTFPPLTTVAQPKREMGRRAVQLITRRVGEERLAPQRALLPVTLAVRRSCGAERVQVQVESTVTRRKT
jgi:LacI family transcriptional regulator